jgi:Fur family transcriptional regulator, peroxide stress response regulator
MDVTGEELRARMERFTDALRQRGRVRFDANVGPHHHFVCTRCGKVGDFTSRDFDTLEVPREVSDIGEVASTHVQFRGLCSRCRGNK